MPFVAKLANLIPYRYRGWIKHLPGIKQWQSRIVKKYLDGRQFVHTIRGGPADGLIYPVEMPVDKAVWLGNYEQSFTEALAAEVVPGMVCYDIGGFRGYFSGVMARQGAASVSVFEPLPENQLQIERLISLNESLPIRLFKVAVADQAGETTLRVMPETSMGKLGSSEFDSGDQSVRSIPVTLETLDRMVEARRLPAADLIKIDVEGAEVMVLQGGRNLLCAEKPVLFIEAHSRKLTREIVDILTAMGYEVTTLETQCAPNGIDEPSVCHLKAVHPERGSGGAK